MGLECAFAPVNATVAAVSCCCDGKRTDWAHGQLGVAQDHRQAPDEHAAQSVRRLGKNELVDYAGAHDGQLPGGISDAKVEKALRSLRNVFYQMKPDSPNYKEAERRVKVMRRARLLRIAADTAAQRVASAAMAPDMLELAESGSSCSSCSGSDCE